MKKTEQGTPEQAHASAARSNPFTTQEFEEAWMKYTAAHPKEHILVNAMRSAVPQSTDNFNFVSEVTNIMQLDLMNEALPQINKWMRDTLQNDSVVITAIVAETPNEARYTLNDRELLAKIIEEKPIIATFIDKLKLVLS